MKMRSTLTKDRDVLSGVTRAVRLGLLAAAFFSMMINLLMLVGPLFMLQIYDRVLTSRSVPTLIALFGLVAVLYVFLGFFNFLRSRVLSRIGHWIDSQLSGQAFSVHLTSGLPGGSRGARPVNDLGTLRNFLSGQGLPSLFDLPWVPMYLIIIYFLHFQLGVLALVALMFIMTIALANEFLTRQGLSEAVILEHQENEFSNIARNNVDSILSMGMESSIARRWGEIRDRAKHAAQSSSDAGEAFASASKALRLFVQSAILALGAYLAIAGEISAGTIIAASILSGRALAPIDQTIANLRSITRARQAYARLSTHLRNVGDTSHVTVLPAPKGQLEVRGLVAYTPVVGGSQGRRQRLILKGMDFCLKPGDVLGVIGPSGAGKSTLARTIVGLLSPDEGSVRLDGATFDQWGREVLGHHIGYLPQAVELLPGTLKQNIARFDDEATDEEVVEAAEAAGAHDLIVRLPNGYATQVGHGLPPLSGGQVQRIALARALFRQPKLIVLDEPSSNLDMEGDKALAQAIIMMKRWESTVVIMTHRPTTLAETNLILVMQDGRQIAFGDKASVLTRSLHPEQPATTHDPSAHPDTPRSRVKAHNLSNKQPSRHPRTSPAATSPVSEHADVPS